MNLKKSLFELERISPRLAGKVWELTSALKSQELGLEWRMIKYTDTQIEARFSTRHFGSLVGVAAERCIEMLWARHLDSARTRLVLKELRARFIKEPEPECRMRCELAEMEREAWLAKLFSQKEVQAEMTAGVFNAKNQSIATVDLSVVIQWNEPKRIERIRAHG